ncbi:MAG: Firmicu-CTERM sorting domain-containing protein [Lachnospiraceae bacterium]
MRKGISILMCVLTAFVFLCGRAETVKAAQEPMIVIDGAFKDWEGIKAVNVSDDNWWYEKISVVFDDTYVYMYVKESDSQVWETRYPTLFFKVNDTVKQVVLTRESYLYVDGVAPVGVRNSWYSDIPGASGKVLREDGRYQWEVAIPIQALLTTEGNEPATEPKPVETDGVAVRVESNGCVLELVGTKLGDAQTGGEEEKPEDVPPVLPTEPEDMDDPKQDTEVTKTDIVIDGYYDDWQDVPATLITYGSWNQHGEYIIEHHVGKLLIDDENLYIHVNMCETYHNQIPLDMLNITINGEERAFCIRYENSDGTVNWDSSVYNLEEGIHTNLGFYAVGDAKMTLGDVAVTIVPGHEGDAFEVAVNLDKLLQYYNIDKSAVSNGAEIKFYSPNIGPEAVVIIGTSTNPVLGIALCILIVGCVAVLCKGKKSKA